MEQSIYPTSRCPDGCFVPKSEWECCAKTTDDVPPFPYILIHTPIAVLSKVIVCPRPSFVTRLVRTYVRAVSGRITLRESCQFHPLLSRRTAADRKVDVVSFDVGITTSSKAAKQSTTTPLNNSILFSSFARRTHNTTIIITMRSLAFASIFLITLAASASAFVPSASRTFAARTRSAVATSKSSLQMVADDAKVIVVTGSSRGLGKAIALELGKNGQKVVVNYVSDGSSEAAEATCQEIKDLGGDAIAIKADSTYRTRSIRALH